MKVHLFGATSSPSCCNYALKKTAIDNKDDFEPAAIDALQRNLYVDDFLKSVESAEEGKRLVQDISLLLSKGGFKLAKWTSNSKEVENSFAPSEKLNAVKPLDLGDDAPRKRALGVQWDTDADTLGFKVRRDEKPHTRRGILSMISSVYDPLGLASPFILSAKIILQDLCRLKISWDEQIPLK